jgi:60 kDa SS-A/Ro ribonucleoprotein
LIDISGSMRDPLSAKSDLIRLDAAKALAILLREVCSTIDFYRFDTSTELVPARRGFALADAVGNTRGGTDVRQAVNFAQARDRYERIIVLTDEQSMSTLPAPQAKGYVINVAAYKNGVGYKQWLHIDGFSEAVVDYITAYEAS